jgi:hypothetical protein
LFLGELDCAVMLGSLLGFVESTQEVAAQWNSDDGVVESAQELVHLLSGGCRRFPYGVELGQPRGELVGWELEEHTACVEEPSENDFCLRGTSLRKEFLDGKNDITRKGFGCGVWAPEDLQDEWHNGSSPCGVIVEHGAENVIEEAVKAWAKIEWHRYVERKCRSEWQRLVQVGIRVVGIHQTRLV